MSRSEQAEVGIASAHWRNCWSGGNLTGKEASEQESERLHLLLSKGP